MESSSESSNHRGEALPRALPQQLGMCPHRSQNLLRVLQSEVDRARLPGAVVLIARHGKLALFESLGRLDPARAQPMPTDALFRIYSMTKPIVSVAVMMLMEQGRLLLGDPIAKYLPEWNPQQLVVAVDGALSPQTVRQGATIQDLLRHTAGLSYEFLGSAPVQRRYAQARIGSRKHSNQEFSRQLAALPLMFQPGTVWEYSRATDVLGRLIEVISGAPLGVHLREHILQPLGMLETWFNVPAEHLHRVAESFGKDPDGGVQMRLFDPSLPAAFESGCAGLVGSTMDYARFLQCMLNRGELNGVRLLAPATVDFMTTDHLGDIPVNPGMSRVLLPPGHGFGLGFAVRKELGVSATPGSVGTYDWGGWGGTSFFVDPALDLFACLMSQAPNQRAYYAALFRDLVYAALVD